jgi:transcriptional regulator with XRE-family HTH domain
MLSQIENGSAKPSMDTLRYLAGQLGKPMGYFLEEDFSSEEDARQMEEALSLLAAAEQALLAAARQVEVDAVVSVARVRLQPGEFGHFLAKVRARREELPPRYTDQPEEEL